MRTCTLPAERPNEIKSSPIRIDIMAGRNAAVGEKFAVLFCGMLDFLLQNSPNNRLRTDLFAFKFKYMVEMILSVPVIKHCVKMLLIKNIRVTQCCTV